MGKINFGLFLSTCLPCKLMISVPYYPISWNFFPYMPFFERKKMECQQTWNFKIPGISNNFSFVTYTMQAIYLCCILSDSCKKTTSEDPFFKRKKREFQRTWNSGIPEFRWKFQKNYHFLSLKKVHFLFRIIFFLESGLTKII